MTPTVARIALMFVVPAAVSIGGAALLTRLSGRAAVTAQLAKLPEEHRKPLNSRWHYDKPAVEQHWCALDEKALAAETRFLEMDLVYPFAYGGAFLTALLLGWAMLGRPFSPAWLVVPVALTVVADWAENLTILPQIRAYAAGGAAALDGGRVAIASVATAVKLAGIVALVVLTIALLILAIRRLVIEPA
jgi:hypothetical protein